MTDDPKKTPAEVADLALARHNECVASGYSTDESRRNAIAFICGAAVVDKSYTQLFMAASFEGLDGIKRVRDAGA